MNNFRKATLTILFISFVLFLSGCKPDNIMSPEQNTGNTTVGIKTAELPNNGGQSVLNIESAKFLFSDIVVMPSGSASIHHLITGPVVGIVNMDSKTAKIVVGEIPNAEYSHIGFRIENSGSPARNVDPEFYDDGFTKSRYTIIIKGTYNSQPFVYKSKVSLDKQLKFINPLNINSDTMVKLTIVVSPRTWFIENGVVLNPNNQNVWSIIDENISESFIGIQVE